MQRSHVLPKCHYYCSSSLFEQMHLMNILVPGPFQRLSSHGATGLHVDLATCQLLKLITKISLY